MCVEAMQRGYRNQLKGGPNSLASIKLWSAMTNQNPQIRELVQAPPHTTCADHTHAHGTAYVFMVPHPWYRTWCRTHAHFTAHMVLHTGEDCTRAPWIRAGITHGMAWHHTWIRAGLHMAWHHMASHMASHGITHGMAWHHTWHRTWHHMASHMAWIRAGAGMTIRARAREITSYGFTLHFL